MQISCPIDWPDYQLIDCGDGEKLERFGSYILIRPEPKALWSKSLSYEDWLRQAHIRFVQGAGFGRAGKEDSGTWEKLKKVLDQWVISYRFGIKMRLGLTAFKHVGVFPEQAPNWDFIYRQTKALTADAQMPAPASASAPSPTQALAPSPTRALVTSPTPTVLNLFAYTGGASLAAKAAGAGVVHVDAVKQVLTWGRENMELSGMDGIRWILEDAFKFVKRQVRRGTLYQGILLDPPAYGHGPEGERWKLDDCLYALLEACAPLLDPRHGFVVLNLYSNGYSALLADTLARKAFGSKIPTAASAECDPFTFGELYIEDTFGKRLPLSVYSRITY